MDLEDLPWLGPETIESPAQQVLTTEQQALVDLFAENERQILRSFGASDLIMRVEDLTLPDTHIDDEDDGEDDGNDDEDDDNNNEDDEDGTEGDADIHHFRPLPAPVCSGLEQKIDVIQEAFDLAQAGARRLLMTKSSGRDMIRTPSEICEAPEPLTLFPYQLAGAGRMQDILGKLKSVLLAWDMGLGKTITVIAHLLNMGFMQSSNTSSTGPVLIILPASLIGTWVDTFQKRLVHASAPRICIYRNTIDKHSMFENVLQTKNLTPLELQSFNIVITTYASVRVDFMRKTAAHQKWLVWRKKRLPWSMPARSRYPLYTIDWWHIIMDEAHQATTPKSLTHRAICDLSSEYRIAMTGTPLQNAITDIQGMFALLHIQPWCDFETFKSFFKQKKTKDHDGLVGDLKTTLTCALKAISLRLRVGDEFNGSPAARFTKIDPQYIYHDLDDDQQAHQDLVKHLWDDEARAAWREERRSGRYTGHAFGEGGIFRAISNARLAAIHPECPNARYGENDEDDDETVQKYLKLMDMQKGAGASKADNDSQLTQKQRRDDFKTKMKDSYQSTRIKIAVDIISDQAKRKRKSVLFSNYLCALDVADAALRAEKIQTLRFDGWQTTGQRNQVLRDFESDESQVLLMTLKSGGAGLNLQMAKTVIHLDVCWNPAIALQGNARVNRCGNTDDVEIYCILARNSLDRYIIATAKRKQRTANSLLDPNETELGNVRKAKRWTRDGFETMMNNARLSAAAYAAAQAAIAAKVQAKKALRDQQNEQAQSENHDILDQIDSDADISEENGLSDRELQNEAWEEELLEDMFESNRKYLGMEDDAEDDITNDEIDESREDCMEQND